MSGLSRAGFNEFQIKYVIGKAIPLRDMTYLQTLEQEIEERYPKAFPQFLNIKPSKIVTVVDESLTQELRNKDREIKELKEHAVAGEEKQKSEMDEIRRDIGTLKSLLVGPAPNRFRTNEELESIITSQKELIDELRKHGLVTTIDAKK
jgi:ribosomal protein L29